MEAFPNRGPATPLYYQVYVMKDRRVTEALVRRAEKAGFTGARRAVPSGHDCRSVHRAVRGGGIAQRRAEGRSARIWAPSCCSAGRAVGEPCSAGLHDARRALSASTARAPAITGIVLTVDTPQLGYREADVAARFTLPPGASQSALLARSRTQLDR